MWVEVEKKSQDGGYVIFSEEGGGARITLEQDSMLGPYLITFGIYGLGFHSVIYNTKKHRRTVCLWY